MHRHIPIKSYSRKPGLCRGAAATSLFWKQQPLLCSLEPVVAIPACDQNGGIVRLPARAMAKPD